MYRQLLFVLVITFVACSVYQSTAQTPKSKCAECALPGTRNIRDTVMDVQFRDKTLLPNCV